MNHWASVVGWAPDVDLGKALYHLNCRAAGARGGRGAGVLGCGWRCALGGLPQATPRRSRPHFWPGPGPSTSHLARLGEPQGALRRLQPGRPVSAVGPIRTELVFGGILFAHSSRVDTNGVF